MHVIDDGLLAECCGHDLDALNPFLASEAALRLGPLARWWLRPEVLETAAEADVPDPIRASWLRRPALHLGSGSCWILVAKPYRRELPLLRPAFILPVIWRREASAYGVLPDALERMARGVRRDMVETGLVDADAADGLRLAMPNHEGLGRIDLSGLEGVTWDSAWLPLAGGLVMAAEGGRPRADVFATGALRDGAIRAVESIEAKLAVAEEWGARTLFAPEEGLERLGDPGSLEVAGVTSDGRPVREVLRPYLEALEVPPPASAPRPSRARHYLRTADEGRARAYFTETCLPEIAGECAEALARRLERPPDALVTIASDSPDLVLLATAALRPRRCLILHTPDRHSDGIRAMEGGELAGCSLELAVFETGPAMRDQLRDAVERFRWRAGGGPLAIDVTPGRKDMSVALALTAARPDDAVLYFPHRMDRPTRRPIPFTQSVEVLGEGTPQPSGDGTAS